MILNCTDYDIYAAIYNLCEHQYVGKRSGEV